MAAAKNKPKFHEILAQNLIAQLQEGTAPWQKPWTPNPAQIPHNAITGKPYRGANVMMLAMRGFEDPRWMTYNQAKAAGEGEEGPAKGPKRDPRPVAVTGAGTIRANLFTRKERT